MSHRGLFLSRTEKFKTVYFDPGEDAGWCVGNGPKLLSAGTEKMWPLADELWMTLSTGGCDGLFGSGPRALACTRKGVGEGAMGLPIGRVVCEDFRIYPNKARSLSWDPVRTARLIGAITMMCRIFDIPFFLQPAAIKPQALLLGAEEYYYVPHHENRHQNDAIQHFVYFRTFGPDGDSSTANKTSESEQGKAHEQTYGFKACGAASSVKRVAGRKIKHDRVTCRKPEDHEGGHDYH